mmetsp:Transcript_3097/g.4563  ORF Transcript_3097/g.4563 Transcript_3097/m.4563 type:complete len:113 (+) Transcript_3097:77-415(+)
MLSRMSMLKNGAHKLNKNISMKTTLSYQHIIMKPAYEIEKTELKEYKCTDMMNISTRLRKRQKMNKHKYRKRFKKSRLVRIKTGRRRVTQMRQALPRDKRIKQIDINIPYSL